MLLLLALLVQDDGAKAYAEGRYTEAAALYEKAIERRPTPELHAALGRCRLQLKEWDAAAHAFEAALKPDSPADVLRGLGHAKLMGGKIDEGIAAFRRARKLDPDGPDALWIARALAQKGAYAAAEAEAAPLDSPEALELLAWLASRRGRHAEAAELYRRLGMKHWVSLGQELAAAGRAGEAIDVLEAARRVGRPEGLRLLADLYLRAEMPREAADAYAALPSPGAEDLARLGHARLRAGDRVSAKEAFERALAADPKRSDVALQLGHLAATPDEARRRYKEANASAALGELELKESRWTEAIAAFTEALKTDRSAATHHNLALALLKSGKDALPAIREGLREHPLDEKLRALLRSQ